MANAKKFHQGDVQAIAINEIPSNAKKIAKQPIALGEHSGHQHVLVGDYELYELEDGRLMAAIGEGGANLQHIHESNFKGYENQEILAKADHHPIVKSITPGSKWIFGIHKKYNPFAKVFERVID